MSELPLIKPDWLKVRVNRGTASNEVQEILSTLKLHTVCEEAACPNCGECFGRHTATFMILGKYCTRNCTFCNVTKAIPTEVDLDEPKNVALAVKELKLKHVVITSVTRDDLQDGGASQFAACIREIRKLNEKVVIEVLIPDFKGDLDALKIVADEKPQIINHNIETAPRLYPNLRPMAIYERSLELLARVKELNPNIVTKSGFMVGVGEKKDEVIAVMQDLLAHQCEILTIGQYLAPSKSHYPVFEYVHPDIFEEYKNIALKMGFRYVASSPLVRSSYLAEKAYELF